MIDDQNCPQCNGTGKRLGGELWAYEYPCEKCGGSGIKIRVWAVCCVFTCLFFLLLLFSMYGCMDSQDQEKIMVDDVRIYYVFPDGTEIDVSDVFPLSEGWEYKEIHD